MKQCDRYPESILQQGYFLLYFSGIFDLKDPKHFSSKTHKEKILVTFQK
jgi:hypothetical protein